MEDFRDSQMRKSLITINNPDDHGYTHERINEKINILGADYYCMADEIGNEKETPHTHVFAHFPSPRRFSTIKKLFSEAHIDNARGSCREIRDYIMKQGKWAQTDKAKTTVEGSFEEHGVMPVERADHQDDKLCVVQMFDAGASVNDVINAFPGYALKVHDLEALQNIRRQNRGDILRDVDVFYIYGDTGTGKTYSVFKEHDSSEVCRLTSYKERGLFDSYYGQSILVFDEYHSQISLPEMLNYLDVYPVSLPARYHNREAAYNTVYILSNLPLGQQYVYEQSNDEKTWKAFLRRINKVYKQLGFDERVEINKYGGDLDEENPFEGG